MLKFHIIIIKFSIFTDKNSQSDTFLPKLKNTIVKIDIKSFSVYKEFQIFSLYTNSEKSFFKRKKLISVIWKEYFSIQRNFP